MSAREVIAESDAAKKWLISPTRVEGADAILDVLRANGYAVVELPEPSGWWVRGPEWRSGCEVVWTAPGSTVMVQNIEPGDLFPDQARALAARLLAAAAAAECNSGDL